MNNSEIVELCVLILFLFLSAFFSSAETALTTVNKIRMRTLAESGNKRAKKVLEITQDSHKMLSAILIGNNVINLSASSLATTLAIRIFGNVGAGIATGILTMLILIFGEISPKTIASVHAEPISLAYAGIINALMRILTPVIFLVNQISMLFLRIMKIDAKVTHMAMTEEEFKTIVDVGHETGVLENTEHEMINNVFDFGDSEAKEIMIPRIDMTFARLDHTYDEIIEIFRENKFTRLPVYKDSTDNVVGIINVKDLLLVEDKDQFQVKNYLREPYFTYEHKNTAELFLEMRQNYTNNIAIVVDEYGVTAGMITLEDLLEEIVGEIRDEYDADEEDPVKKLNDREFLVQGSLNLDDLCDELSLPFTSEDYDTIGGFLIGLLDHVPEKNEVIITDEGILLKVEKMDKNRIEQVYIKLPNPDDPEPEE